LNKSLKKRQFEQITKKRNLEQKSASLNKSPKKHQFEQITKKRNLEQITNKKAES
jgi:hypothetical protein